MIDNDRETAKNIVECLREIDRLDGRIPQDPDDYDVEKVLERIKRAKGCSCTYPE